MLNHFSSANHDGIICVFSEKGEGTAFNIYLPATEKKSPGSKAKIMNP